MVKESKTSTVAIQNLLEEKRQIERWLRRLDMASDKTPANVRKKVRVDYSQRRDAILAELQGFRDDLNASLQKHREVRDELARREEDAAERLAEAELRHTVGEFDSSKWSEIRAEILEELVKIREELKTEQAEIGQLEEVLDAIDGSGPTEEEDETEADVAGSEQAATDAEGEAGAELELSKGKEGAAAGTGSRKSADELAFLRSVISGEKEPEGTEVQEPAPAEESEPHAAARPKKGTARKTVKCTDCGTLNLPTEWYCENCGAELTAL